MKKLGCQVLLVPFLRFFISIQTFNKMGGLGYSLVLIIEGSNIVVEIFSPRWRILKVRILYKVNIFVSIGSPSLKFHHHRTSS